MNQDDQLEYFKGITHLYDNANALDEGPNVSHRPEPQLDLVVFVGVVMTILFIVACLPQTRALLQPIINMIFGGN